MAKPLRGSFRPALRLKRLVAKKGAPVGHTGAGARGVRPSEAASDRRSRLQRKPEQRYQHGSEVKTAGDAIRASAPAVGGLSNQGKPVAGERAPAGPWAALRLCVLLAAWTAVVVGACVDVLPKAMMEWWPWAYDER